MENEIVKFLVNNRKPFKEIDTWSSIPGVYALFFHGKGFPLDNFSPQNHEIIYLGKTESSQLARDKNTHFTSGKTGSSTLRRSFGSMLRTQYDLQPIPRGEADILKQRTSHFKFNDHSEELLSNWMRDNLSLSFYAFKEGPAALDELETYLIKLVKPILNIDRKNSDNPYAPAIKRLRKQTGEIAYSAGGKATNSRPKSIVITSKFSNRTLKESGSQSVNKYEFIWVKYRPVIKQALKTGQSTTIGIGASLFKQVGNRKRYSFRLEYTNGIVSNNIEGSAVARDLARVIDRDNDLKSFFFEKTVTFRLNSNFELEIIT